MSGPAQGGANVARVSSHLKHVGGAVARGEVHSRRVECHRREVMRDVGEVYGHGREARVPVMPVVAHVAQVFAHLREVSKLVERGRENPARVDCQGGKVSGAVCGVYGHARQVRGGVGQRGAHLARVPVRLREVSGRMRKMSRCACVGAAQCRMSGCLLTPRAVSGRSRRASR